VGAAGVVRGAGQGVYRDCVARLPVATQAVTPAATPAANLLHLLPDVTLAAVPPLACLSSRSAVIVRRAADVTFNFLKTHMSNNNNETIIRGSAMGALSTGRAAPIDAAEWAARIDLAAAHRIAHEFGWTQLIYNHFTARVPGHPEHFLVKPHQMMFAEVTASSLIKVDLDGRRVGDGPAINAAGFAIHTAALRARAEVNAVLHVHTPAGMAISAHPSGLRFMTQAAMRFWGTLAYHDYHGVAEIDEIDLIQRDLGMAKAMILRNHGLLVVGPTMSIAMSRLNYLMTAIESQLQIEATGVTPLQPTDAMCERAARQWDAIEQAEPEGDWPAMLRWMDRVDAGYRV